MSTDATPVSEITVVRPPGELLTVPAIIADQGDRAARRFLEFFTANIRNANTRAAYAQAVSQFLSWCQIRRPALRDIQPLAVAAYIEPHPGSDPTIKQHLAAIKMLFDWLVTGQVVEANPAASVRAPKHVVKKGKTPVLTAKEARKLLDSIPLKIGPQPKEGEPDDRPPDLIGLRDRALICVMVYSFARVGAVTGMEVKDYYQNGKRCWLRLHEKGGKFHEVPADHNAEAYLDAYIEASGIAAERKRPLLRSAAGKTGSYRPAAWPQECPRHGETPCHRPSACQWKSAATPSGRPASPPTLKTAAPSTLASHAASFVRSNLAYRWETLARLSSLVPGAFYPQPTAGRSLLLTRAGRRAFPEPSSSCVENCKTHRDRPGAMQMSVLHAQTHGNYRSPSSLRAGTSGS